MMSFVICCWEDEGVRNELRRQVCVCVWVFMRMTVSWIKPPSWAPRPAKPITRLLVFARRNIRCVCVSFLMFFTAVSVLCEPRLKVSKQNPDFRRTVRIVLECFCCFSSWICWSNVKLELRLSFYDMCFYCQMCITLLEGGWGGERVAVGLLYFFCTFLCHCCLWPQSDISLNCPHPPEQQMDFMVCRQAKRSTFSILKSHCSYAVILCLCVSDRCECVEKHTDWAHLVCALRLCACVTDLVQAATCARKCASGNSCSPKDFLCWQILILSFLPGVNFCFFAALNCFL